jgi:hypothetical protein
VALSGNGTTALIGADLYDNGAGAAYVFQGSWGNWTQVQGLMASDYASYDEFGFSVALSGDGSTALVGAPEYDAQSTGAAYIF